MLPRFVTRSVAHGVSPASVAHASYTLFNEAQDITLSVASVAGAGVVRGAFESNRRAELPTYRRASGGRSARLTDGSMYCAFFLPRPEQAAPDVNAGNLLNRLLRPLLKALSGMGALAHYFGRDWVAIDKRPAVTVAFAHERNTGRTLIEAFLGVSSSVAVDPEHVSYLGKQPDSIERLARRPLDLEELTKRIVHAYAVAYHFEWRDQAWPSGAATELEREPAWQSTVSEPIGLVGARRDEQGTLHLGGELMMSHDVLRGLTEWLGSARGESEIDEALRACLGGDEVAMFGLRDASSLKHLVLSLPVTNEYNVTCGAQRSPHTEANPKGE